MEAKALMRWDGKALVPADATAAAMVAKLKTGDKLLVKVHRARNPEHHGKFFALLSFIADNTDGWTTDSLLVAIKLALKRYDLVRLPNGKVIPAPQSISFESMSQDEFARFYDDAVALLLEHVVPKWSRADLETGVREILAGRTAA